jgi:Glycosyltransferases involved in cell wall biogenesis
MSHPQQIHNSDILVIVPVYNESSVMVQTLTQLAGAGYQVIVVDDGSDVLVKKTIGHLPVTILRHRVNLGQGAALQTAFNYAKKKTRR